MAATRPPPNGNAFNLLDCLDCGFLSRHITVWGVLQGSVWLRGSSLHIQNSSAEGDVGGFFAKDKLVMQDLAQKPQMTPAFGVESSGLKVRTWARKLK